MSPTEKDCGASSEDSGASSPQLEHANQEGGDGAKDGSTGVASGRRRFFVFPSDKPEKGIPLDSSKSYAVVAWDLDTTGRRLLDEICQIGAFTKEGGPLKVVPAAEKPKKKQEGEGAEEEDDEDEDAVAKAKEDERKGGRSFAQYVMPYKNPNPGARKSFGIRVVNIGRYRMLKDMESGKILKTKSEVSALTDFIAWLKQVKVDSGKDMVLLACHEPNRKVLVPLLLESLRKYSLVDEFKAIVAGFANGIHVVGKYGDKEKITSLSLRSLCKTVLSDTNPQTNSASDRCSVLVDIISSLAGPGKDKGEYLNCAGVAETGVTVDSEVDDLAKLKGMLGTQATLRPIFESQLRQKRSVRERALTLRKKVAEAGVDYKQLSEIYTECLKVEEKKQEDEKKEGEDAEEAGDKKEVEPKEEKEEESAAKKEEAKSKLQDRVKAASDDDVEELVRLMKLHFEAASSPGGDAANFTEEGGRPIRRGGGYRRGGFRRGRGGRPPRGGAGRSSGGPPQAAAADAGAKQEAKA